MTPFASVCQGAALSILHTANALRRHYAEAMVLESDSSAVRCASYTGRAKRVRRHKTASVRAPRMTRLLDLK